MVDSCSFYLKIFLFMTEHERELGRAKKLCFAVTDFTHQEEASLDVSGCCSQSPQESSPLPILCLGQSVR